MYENDLELIILGHFKMRADLWQDSPDANVIPVGLAGRLNLGMNVQVTTSWLDFATVSLLFQRNRCLGHLFSKWKRHDLISRSSGINAAFSLALCQSVAHPGWLIRRMSARWEQGWKEQGWVLILEDRGISTGSALHGFRHQRVKCMLAWFHHSHSMGTI